jgi:hypothetical protein
MCKIRYPQRQGKKDLREGEKERGGTKLSMETRIKTDASPKTKRQTFYFLYSLFISPFERRFSIIQPFLQQKTYSKRSKT